MSLEYEPSSEPLHIAVEPDLAAGRVDSAGLFAVLLREEVERPLARRPLLVRRPRVHRALHPTGSEREARERGERERERERQQVTSPSPSTPPDTGLYRGM